MAKSKNVQEANDKFKCKVTKTREDGEVVWTVNELDGLWVATFHDEAAARAFAEQYPKMKADYIAKSTQTEAEKLNEVSLNLHDLKEVTVDDMLKLAKKLYPHNSDGGKTSPIVGIVDGHLADFTAVAFAKHEGHPDPGTFFLHDGTQASLNALEEQLEVGQYGEAEKADEPFAELKATAEKLKQYNSKYVSWEELTELADDNGALEQHIWLKSPNGILVCRMDSYGEKATYYIVDKDSNKLVEVGHDGMKGMFKYAFMPSGTKMDIPDDMPTSLESKLEKELDDAIEEGLKEIYR